MTFTYKRALIILAISVLLELRLFRLFWSFGGDVAALHYGLTRIITLLCIAVGLLLYSKLARYLGAIYFLFTTPAELLGLFYSGSFSTESTRLISVAIIIIIQSILLLICSYILLFSATFSAEFSRLRLSASRHLNLARTILWGLIILYVVWKISVDVYRLLGLSGRR